MSKLSYWQDKLVLRKKKLADAEKRLARAKKSVSYWEDLVEKAKEHIAENTPKPRDKAVTWALSKRGIKEQPANSNKGPQISDWQKHWTGTDGYSWCGAFAGYALYKAGVKGLVGKNIIYTPSIVNDAKAGRNGFLKTVSLADAQKGDLLLFNWDGGVVDHVGIFTGKRFASGAVESIEGNTSSDDRGSQSNGGGVFLRARAPGLIQVVARPRWS